MRRTASYLGFRVAWPPLFVYWNRDPAPWDAERKGVHAAFLARAAVFWALNLFWFWSSGARTNGTCAQPLCPPSPDVAAALVSHQMN